MNEELDALRPKLLELDASELESPSIPYAVAFQEAHDMLAFVAKPEVAAALSKVGLKKEVLTEAPKALDAARQAQALWATSRRARTPEGLLQARDEAIALRSGAVAALRWNARGNRVVQAAVDAVMEGNGDADLIQDLLDLSALIASNASAFDDDETFDAPEQAQKARDAAQALRAQASGVVTDATADEALDLRDRAFTYLEQQLDELRAAGRYALRGDTSAVLRFGSAYLRRKTAAARKRKASAAPAES